MDADMDGFRLLEQVGLEMDLPVISESHTSPLSGMSPVARIYACRTLANPM